MSGGESLWRRVAGLYLSGVPIDGREPMSTRATAAAGAEDHVTDPKRDIVMLGEALDLVTLAQGYTSPAVPMLLRALIRAVRQLAAAQSEEAAAEAAPAAAGPEVPEAAQEAAQTEETPPEVAAEAPETAERPTEPVAESAVETPAPTPEDTARYAVLEKKVTETDQKMAALTGAVGQLVDILQRRTREGGGVERRASPRVPGGNARLYVRGAAYEVVNWSRSGFLIRIAETDRFSRGPFDYHFVLELPDETIEFQGRATPVRIERALLAAEFAALDAATASRLADVSAQLAAAPV